MATYSKETALYDTGAIANGISAAGQTATSYITNVSGGGIMVHPSDDSTSGWKISSTLELLKGGVAYIKAWLGGTNQHPIPAVRIGTEDGGHTNITEGGMTIYGGSDGTAELAHIGHTDDAVPEGGGSLPHVDAPYYSFGARSSSGDIGAGSFSEGGRNVASGAYSHAEGKSTQAVSDCAHAEGYYSKAVELYSHAEGWQSEAHGWASHAEGEMSYADQEAQTVVGRYNKKTPSGQTYEDRLFTVGCGTSDSARANAFEVKQNPLGASADDRLPKIELNELPLFKVVANVPLNAATFPADGYTANNQTKDVSSYIPDGYSILAAIPRTSGGNSLVMYYCEPSGNNVLYRIRNYGSAVTATPAVRLILINKGAL